MSAIARLFAGTAPAAVLRWMIAIVAAPFWEFPPDQLHDLTAVVVAAFLAGIVGIEREFANKPAGFRTHMIIGGAAALLVLLGKSLAGSFSETDIPGMRVDPIRIMEAIIVGVSFIGAGSILQSEKGERILYLTTAASTLFSAGIGMCVALDRLHLAAGVTIAILVINLVFGRLDHWMAQRRRGQDEND